MHAWRMIEIYFRECEGKFVRDKSECFEQIFFFFLRIILILTISIIFCRILCAKKKKNYQELYKYSPWRIFFLLFVRFSLDARQESRVQSELAFRFIERLFNKIVDLLYFFFFLFLSLSLLFPFLWSTTGLYPDRLNIWTGSTSLMKFPVSPRERELSSRSLERLQS